MIANCEYHVNTHFLMQDPFPNRRNYSFLIAGTVTLVRNDTSTIRRMLYSCVPIRFSTTTNKICSRKRNLQSIQIFSLMALYSLHLWKLISFKQGMLTIKRFVIKLDHLTIKRVFNINDNTWTYWYRHISVRMKFGDNCVVDGVSRAHSDRKG